MDDSDLLHRYATSRAEGAFRELVERHMNLVYSAALRQCGGDAHRAEDVVQAVFAELARKAGTLANHAALSGWLYTTTHFTAAKLRRSESRRKARELEAHTMHEILGQPESVDIGQIRATLDDAMHGLSEQRRTALVLHFLDRRPMVEVGVKLGLTESGARKNIERGLEELRLEMARRGLTSTAAALGGFLGGPAIQAAPAGLAAAVSGSVLSGATAAASAAGILQFMSLSKLTGAILGAIAVVGAGVALKEMNQNSLLQADVADLSRQAAEIPRLRAGNQKLQAASAEISALRDEVDRLKAELAAMALMKAAPAPAPAVAIKLAIAPQDVPAGTLAEGLTPAEAWQNLGRSTAGDAMMTSLWAAREKDIELLATTTMFAADAKPIADAMFAGMPEAVRAEYVTAERWISSQMANSQPFAGATVLDQTEQGPDDMLVKTRWEYTDGRVRDNTWQFHRGPDGNWQRVIPRALLEKAKG